MFGYRLRVYIFISFGFGVLGKKSRMKVMFVYVSGGDNFYKGKL